MHREMLVFTFNILFFYSNVHSTHSLFVFVHLLQSILTITAGEVLYFRNESCMRDPGIEPRYPK